MPTQQNAAINRETTRNILYTEAMGTDAIWARLDELDREPNIELFVKILRADGFRFKQEIQTEREALLRLAL